MKSKLTEKPLPALDYLRECFNVNYFTGDVFWKERPTNHFNSIVTAQRINRRFSGKKLKPSCNGYVTARIGNNLLSIHRVIYAIYNNCDPIGYEIDHSDGDRSNNAITNLRKATHSQNGMNRKGADIRSSSKILGVSFCKQTGLWKARCEANGKAIWGGRHSTKKEAAKKARELRQKYQGDFAGNVNYVS